MSDNVTPVDPAAHVRLVWWVVVRVRRPGEDPDDLFGAGAVGLCTAARKYRAGRGTFATYAAATVRGYVLQFRTDESAWRRLRGRGTRPSVPGPHLVLFSEFGRDYVRGRAPEFARPDPALERVAAADAVDVGALLRHLRPRQAEVVARFYGLGGRPPESFAAIAASLGVSRERVRQIESAALVTLRRVAKLCGIKSPWETEDG